MSCSCPSSRSWCWARSPHPVIWPAVLMTFVGIWMLAGGSLSDLNGGDLTHTRLRLHVCGAVILSAALSGRATARDTLLIVQFSPRPPLLRLGRRLRPKPVSLRALTGALPNLLFLLVADRLAFTFQVIATHTPTAPQPANLSLSNGRLFRPCSRSLLLVETVPMLAYAGGIADFPGHSAEPNSADPEARQLGPYYPSAHASSLQVVITTIPQDFRATTFRPEFLGAAKTLSQQAFFHPAGTLGQLCHSAPH